MKCSCILIFAVLYAGLEYSDAWKNKYDKPFKFKCSGNKAISRLRSKHVNRHEDRLYDFKCSRVPGRLKCRWTGYLNKFDKPISMVCPNGGVIGGFSSYHSNHHEDRRWNVYCCKNTKFLAQNCRYTGWTKFDQKFNYVVPRPNVLQGFSSVHHNLYEDRIWKFLVCSYSRRG